MEMATARDRLVDSLVANDIVTKPSTEAALRAVSRHEFVGDDQQEQAYQDRPLPIGNDQTISAPHIVGQMLDLIGVEPGDRVLEIGTGCGYHAAVTSEVVGDGNVYSVEYDTELGEAARERLDRLATMSPSGSVTAGRGGPRKLPSTRAISPVRPPTPRRRSSSRPRAMALLSAPSGRASRNSNASQLGPMATTRPKRSPRCGSSRCGDAVGLSRSRPQFR